MKHALVVGAALAGLVLLAPAATAAPSDHPDSNPNGSAPEQVTDEPIFVPAAPTFCDFPVRIDFTGRTKTVTTGDGRTITLSPGQKATVTNLDTGAQKTYVITGSIRPGAPGPDGSVTTDQIGRNLVGDPDLRLSIVIGNFPFTAGPDGTITDSAAGGRGRVISICEDLS